MQSESIHRYEMPRRIEMYIASRNVLESCATGILSSSCSRFVVLSEKK